MNWTKIFLTFITNELFYADFYEKANVTKETKNDTPTLYIIEDDSWLWGEHSLLSQVYLIISVFSFLN